MPRKLNKNYYDHDDRMGGSNHNIRKVSFMNGSGRIRKNKRPDNMVVRCIADDDVEMRGGDRQPWKGGKQRKNFRGRPGSPGVRGTHQLKPLRINDWYQIQVFHGAKYGKPYILQLLLKYLSPKVFIPNSYMNSGKDAIFYVDDHETAVALRNANRKILFEDGFLMEIRVKEGFPPPVQIDEKVKEQIKLVMAKRYIAENKALDLTKFSSDPAFEGGLFCPLSRPPVMKAVWQIISENISDLVALNLTNNKIAIIDNATSIEIKKLKNLKILHLGGNRIKSTLTLNCFKDLELTELVLKDNPVVDMFKDNAHYVRYGSGVTMTTTQLWISSESDEDKSCGVDGNVIKPFYEWIDNASESFVLLGAGPPVPKRKRLSLWFECCQVSFRGGGADSGFIYHWSFHSEIRKIFPKLTKLDDIELPPVISFDVAEEGKLPPPQAAYVCNPDGRGIVKEFLSQYFALYDSDNRLNLVQAYHDNSSFSMCAYYPQNQKASANKLQSYIVESRNLFRIHDFPRRKNRLRSGKQNIVQFLSQLPKTQHDLSSFVVDLTLFTPALLNLSVNGVFRETNPSQVASVWPVRHFTRTFLIVPVNQGFCIINEMLAITNASDAEVECSFKEQTQSSNILQSPSSSHQPEVSAVTSALQSVQLDESVQLQMVQTLATRTGMNLEWSKKCLDETQWDFDRAIWTFTELQSKGTIPAEAFVK